MTPQTQCSACDGQGWTSPPATECKPCCGTGKLKPKIRLPPREVMLRLTMEHSRRLGERGE